MARKKKTDSSAAVSLDDLMPKINAAYGQKSMTLARQVEYNPARLPTGIVAVDFAAGGGLPIHGSTCAWGPESGGKTRLAIAAMRVASLICWKCFNVLEDCTCHGSPMVKKSVLVDVEGTSSVDWLHSCGVPRDSYYYVLGNSGEQYVNIAEAALQAYDCGLLIFDSLASLVPEKEFDAPMEDQNIALSARLVSRAVKRLKQRMIRERKLDHTCTTLFTNQMRMKIGQMFGDPETMPGGHGMKHEFSLLFRCSKVKLESKGKDSKYFDDEFNKALASRHNITIRKDKITTLSGSGTYIAIKSDIPDLGLTKGMIDDFTVTANLAKDFEVIWKDEAAHVWRCQANGKRSRAATVADFKEYWKSNPMAYLRVQQEIIRKAIQLRSKED